MKRLQFTRLLVIFLSVMVLAFGTAGGASAQDFTFDDTVPAGETVENDILLVGDQVAVDGAVVGDMLAVGSTIRIRGPVSGSLVAIGRELDIDGEVDGTVYGLGVQMALGPSAALGRNMYFLGVNLDTDPASVVGRDLLTLALGADLQGQVGRDVNAKIGVLQLIQLIAEAIGQPLSGLPIGALLPGGSASASASVQLSGILPLDRLLSSMATASGVSENGQIDTQQLAQWGLQRLRDLLTIFIFGLLGIWLLSGQLNRSVEIFRTGWLRALGIGLLAYVIVFNIILVAILLAVLIAVLGYFLGAATLWGLALVVWALGAAVLGLAFTIFWLFVVYGTKALVSYLIGRLILDRLAPRATRYKVVPLLLGLVIYVILSGISILGWVVTVLVTAIGLGLSWMVWRNSAIAKPATVEA